MLTNILKLACVFSLVFAGVVGCDDDGSTTTQDLASASIQDLAQGATGNDLSMPQNGDGGSSDGGGLKAICAPCTADGECESGSCLPDMGGQKHYCSHSCTAATAATDCPGVAMCGGMGDCKCP